eukprot:s6351_g1.t1
MPKRTIGKRKGTAKAKAVAVKKMPRPAVKQVKQEASESGKNVRGTFHVRQAENNRKRRLAWKARQRDAMDYFKKKRQEEESRPAEIIAVERTGHGREIHRKVFNPASGKREVMNITVGERSTEGGNTKKLITSFKGFSKRPVDELRCGHCGEVGHIISMCPQMSRRVSLTQSAVVLTPRTGIYEPAPSEIEDTIRPEDSVSTVAAGLTAESLKAHNRRLEADPRDSSSTTSTANSTSNPSAITTTIDTTTQGEANPYWGSPSSQTTSESPSDSSDVRKEFRSGPSYALKEDLRISSFTGEVFAYGRSTSTEVENRPWRDLGSGIICGEYIRGAWRSDSSPGPICGAKGEEHYGGIAGRVCGTQIGLRCRDRRAT